MDINASNSPLALGSLQQGDDDFRGRFSQGTASRGSIAAARHAAKEAMLSSARKEKDFSNYETRS
jgi:hypothetical protein